MRNDPQDKTGVWERRERREAESESTFRQSHNSRAGGDWIGLLDIVGMSLPWY